MATPITHILNSWGQAFPYCNISANEFYSLVEETIQKHQFPDVTISRTKNKEGGMLSASREYLQVRHKDLVFEICAMKFGTDFSITSWLFETEGVLRQVLKFTKAGDYLRQRASKRTFYQADQEAMFKFCIHNSVLEAIDKISSNKGLRSLSIEERQLR